MAIDYGTFIWPSASAGANPSVGPNGAIAPTSSTEIGGIDPGTGFLVPVAVTSTGQVQVVTSQGTITGVLTQAAIIAGLAAVRLTVSGAAPNPARKQLIFQPDQNALNTVRFFFGSSAVTVGSGIEIFPGQGYIFGDDASDYYIISNTAAQTVYVSEEV